MKTKANGARRLWQIVLCATTVCLFAMLAQVALSQDASRPTSTKPRTESVDARLRALKAHTEARTIARRQSRSSERRYREVIPSKPAWVIEREREVRR